MSVGTWQLLFFIFNFTFTAYTDFTLTPRQRCCEAPCSMRWRCGRPVRPPPGLPQRRPPSRCGKLVAAVVWAAVRDSIELALSDSAEARRPARGGWDARRASRPPRARRRDSAHIDYGCLDDVYDYVRAEGEQRHLEPSCSRLLSGKLTRMLRALLGRLRYAITITTTA